MEFAKLSYEIDRLNDLVEERNRLVDVLQIKPSNKDTVNLKKQLNFILSLLNAQPEINQAQKYNDIVESISKDDDSFENNQRQLYLYNIEHLKAKEEQERLATLASREPVKKVRFTDKNEVEENYDSSKQLSRHQPVSVNFSPYKDDVPYEPQNDRSSAYSMTATNEDILHSQQTVMQDQDDVIHSLSSTIHRTHNMSLDIHNEVEYQNDGLLADLENMVDSTTSTLNNAHLKLARFNKMNRDSGGSLCRGCLIFVLFVLLLVVIVL